MAYLVPQDGGAPVEVPPSPDELTIGRSEDVTIQITDVKSSRNHCAVFEENGTYKVRDNNSRNGTEVNGEAITEKVLASGDVITIGKTRFVFQPTAGPALEDQGFDEDDGESPDEETWILVRAGEGGEEEVHELGDRVTIGRKPSNTIQVRDTKASGVNTEIVRDGPGYTVRDLNSTNGTRVDGKLITEPMGLYHGSVVTVGKSDFIIKNTAIPDLGEPGFESQALGGEDFTAFARKRRRRLPVGFLLLVALSFAGLFAFNKLAKVSVTGPKTTISPEGNLLVENYSFEEQAGDGDFPPGYAGILQPDDQVLVTSGTAPTGKAWVEIVKGENNPPDAEAELIYASPIDASTDATYELKAKLKAEGVKGVVGLKITWLKKKDPLYRRVNTSVLLSGDTDWQEVILKANPPKNVSAMEVGVFFTGSEGAILCDDLALYKGKAEETLQRVEGKHLGMAFDNHGVFSVRRVGLLKDAIWNGQVLIIGSGGKGKSLQIFSTLDEGYPKKTEAGLEIKGRIFEFLSQQWIPFTQTVTLVQGEMKVAYTVSPPKGTVDLAGMVFSPEQAKVAAGVGIATSETYTVLTGTFERDGVTRMLWGKGGGRLSINYDPPVTCLQKREAKELKFLQVVPPAEDGSFRFTLFFQTEFSEAEMEVVELRDKAASARRDGRMGEAATHYRAIITKHPYHPDAKASQTAVAEIEAKARQAYDNLRARFDKAKFFNALQDLQAMRDEAQVLADTYGGISFTQLLVDLQKEISLACADLKLAQGRERVEGLLLRARDYVSMGDKALARTIYDYIQAEYPGTEWAEKAAEERQQIK